MIVAEQLNFAHKGSKINILENLSLRIADGVRAVLLGPNGCGKSTLFMCLAGLWPISAGQISMNGQKVTALNYRQRAKLVAVVPQTHVPQFSYTVFEAVLMGRAPHVPLHSAPSGEDREIAHEALTKVRLGHLANRAYTQISGGERQMVLVARALAQRSPIILLDEPTSHLDFKNQYEVLDLIGQVAAGGSLTILMTLHDPNQAHFFADHILMLENKTISCEGCPDQVLTEERLQSLYQAPVGVREQDGIKMIYSKKQKAVTE